MNIIKRILPIGLATLLILVTAGVIFTSADEGDSEPKGPRFNTERRAAVQAALEDGDYDAWVAAKGQDDRDPKVLELINADNFARFVEMHNLMKEGKKEEAQVIADELGLPQWGMNKGRHGQFPELTDEQKATMEKVHELMKAGDKNGAKALIKSSGISFPKMGMGGKGFNFPELTDEQKVIMEKVRELKEAGDIEGAHALLEEAGLPIGPKGGMGGKGFNRPELTDEQKAVMEQVRELMKSGDTEAAQKLAEEAGFPCQKGMGKHQAGQRENRFNGQTSK